MKEKAFVKAGSGGTKKREKAGKIKKTSVSSKKSAAQKKETKSVKPGVAKGKKNVKATAKTKTKVGVEAKVKTTKRSARPTEEKKKQLSKPPKKAVGKEKQGKKTSKKTSGPKKIPLKPAAKSKVPRKVAGKIKQAKQATAGKDKIGTKAPPQKEKIKTARIAGKSAIETGVRIVSVPLLTGRLRRRKPAKATKTGKDGRISDLAHGEPAGTKEGGKTQPPPGKEHSPSRWKTFPDEYGENYIKLMTVDPHKLFAFWEVREDAREAYGGDLNIRIHDMTGTDTDSVTPSYFDMTVDERIGKAYIEVNPAGQFAAEIGILYDGIFLSLAKSMRVATPRAGVPEQGVWPQEIYAAGRRTGY